MTIFQRYVTTISYKLTLHSLSVRLYTIAVTDYSGYSYTLVLRVFSRNNERKVAWLKQEQ